MIAKCKACQKVTRMEYIGKQETTKPNVYVHLYNCEACHTTLAYTTEQIDEFIEDLKNEDYKKIIKKYT